VSSAGLLSWGNHPRLPQIPTSCHWRAELPQHFHGLRHQFGTTLAYGAGMSYGDSCLAASGHVLHMRPLDRFIAADWSAGVLTAEAGVTLQEILAVAIPRGWFLSVTPGTKYATLGGAIANDVHGKNHHRRGTFGRHVRRFGLLRSDAGRMICSPQQHADLFQASIGGLGLTGVIEWAEIELMPIRSSRLNVITQRFANLDEFFALSSELDEKHEFCVSWVDCLAKGREGGRGIYMAGDFEDSGPLAVETRRKLDVPFTPPMSLVNPMSLRLFNELYWRRAPREPRRDSVGYDPFFYPLDAISKWNRIYGRRGFQQYQAVIPEAAARDGVHALLAAIAASGTGSFLAVLKRCGALASPGLMSFPHAGTTLALDFPHSDRLVTELFPRLDAIVREADGRLYPAKDAHMSGEDFRRAYPAWKQVEALRDPSLMSCFWRRVTR
jgi:FAD/FMN-containing dehydrogenase